MKEIKTLEEICSEYKLPKDERNEIGNKINAIMDESFNFSIVFIFLSKLAT